MGSNELNADASQTCKVCGEPAAGFHFGAFTCEGCKSFFGRTHNNISSLGDCKNNGRCVINKKTRTSCKRCRLRKCIMVGMSKHGSRYGRRSNWFKIHFLMQSDENIPSNTNTNDSSCKRSKDDDKLHTDTDRESLFSSQDSEDALKFGSSDKTKDFIFARKEKLGKTRKFFSTFGNDNDAQYETESKASSSSNTPELGPESQDSIFNVFKATNLLSNGQNNFLPYDQSSLTALFYTCYPSLLSLYHHLSSQTNIWNGIDKLNTHELTNHSQLQTKGSFECDGKLEPSTNNLNITCSREFGKDTSNSLNLDGKISDVHMRDIANNDREMNFVQSNSKSLEWSETNLVSDELAQNLPIDLSFKTWKRHNINS